MIIVWLNMQHFRACVDTVRFRAHHREMSCVLLYMDFCDS